MMRNGALKLGAAVVVGYLAGRSRKGRMLIPAVLAGLAAKKGVEDRLGASPLGAAGAEVARQLQTSAGKALAARVETLSDTLRERTAAIRDGAAAAGAAGQQAGETAGKAADQARSQVPTEATGTETGSAGGDTEDGADSGDQRGGGSSSHAAGGGRRGASASTR
ncbi:MAG: hypothetical protein J2P45_11390 [Candidatus Dormibacteraeota bacterium]|nr:hypothetical protein [Candidatus Dormibacteraeota bacterium]